VVGISDNALNALERYMAGNVRETPEHHGARMLLCDEQVILRATFSAGALGGTLASRPLAGLAGPADETNPGAPGISRARAQKSAAPPAGDAFERMSARRVAVEALEAGISARGTLRWNQVQAPNAWGFTANPRKKIAQYKLRPRMSRKPPSLVTLEEGRRERARPFPESGAAAGGRPFTLANQDAPRAERLSRMPWRSSRNIRSFTLSGPFSPRRMARGWSACS
jgi:hypothetical protein